MSKQTFPAAIRDQKMQELRMLIETMKQSRDELSLAYNEGLLEGRLSELASLGVLCEEDVSALEAEASCRARQ